MEILNFFSSLEEILGHASFVLSFFLFFWNLKISKKSRKQAKEIRQIKEKSDILLGCLLGASNMTYQVNGGEIIRVDDLSPDQVMLAASEQRVLRDFQARNGRIFADKVERASESHFNLSVNPEKLKK